MNKFRTRVKLNISKKCCVCGKELKSLSGLSSHIKQIHKMSYIEYSLKFYGIDLIKIEKEYQENVEINREKGKAKSLAGLKKYTDSIKGKSIKERLGYEGYENFRKNMKGIFTLEWYVNKYGEDGVKKYQDRCKNISKTTYFRKYNKENKNNWSKISQELFWNIYKIISSKFHNIYFGELNHEYSCGVSRKNYDFVVLDNKKIIEFNGDKFHANPKYYTECDIPIKFYEKCAKQVWKEDKIKLNKAKKNGYDILVIWENDYNKCKNDVIIECVEFLLK